MSDLGLQEATKRNFRYLLDEFHYKCIESTPFRVRFDSAKVRVDVVFDGTRSYELDVLIATTDWIASGNAAFALVEVLRFRGAPETERFASIQVTSRQAMTSFVSQLAELLHRYGRDLLLGNDHAFVELAEQRRREIDAYALQRALRAARTRADVAWREKDYTRFVDVLKPLRSNLSASEIKRLEFAEKQLIRSVR